MTTSNKDDAVNPTTMTGVEELLQQWRTTHHKTIQEAHTLIDYGGGITSALLLLYRNPYVIVALIAMAIWTPIIQVINQKPMILLGFLFLFKRHMTPKGDQNIPGQLLTVSTALTTTDNTKQ